MCGETAFSGSVLCFLERGGGVDEGRRKYGASDEKQLSKTILIHI